MGPRPSELGRGRHKSDRDTRCPCCLLIFWSLRSVPHTVLSPGQWAPFLTTTNSAHRCPLCGRLPSAHSQLAGQGPAGHGDEELPVVSGIDRQVREDHLKSGQHKVWRASPLALKSESEPTSAGPEEATSGRTRCQTSSREIQDWWIRCSKHGLGLLGWPFDFSLTPHFKK